MTTITILGKSMPATVMVAMLVVAGAGAAAGAGVAGSIGGEMTTEVDQAIVLNTDDPGDIPEKEGFVNVNDDGSEFRTAAQIYQGDNYDVEMNFSYQGQTETNAELVLDIPKGIVVDVEPTVDENDANVQVGQVAEDTWLLKVNESENGDGDFDFELTFDIGTDNQIEPGFYTIDGYLAPVDV